jgi:beta-lactamase regulating signal transducer with metallopeptidase domain
MGIVIHRHMSLYSIMMGMLWFSVFILLGMLLRKLKFPLRYSAVPLLLSLVLSILRMFIFIEIPGMVIILSGTFYPAIISFLRIELMTLTLGASAFSVSIASLLVCVWAVMAFVLTVRYSYDYFIKIRPVMRFWGRGERDEYAESLLAGIIGHDKKFRVFRNGCLNTAIATAFKPYIVLPKVDFSPDSLRVVLLHEWKHIQDKDYLTGIIIELICCLLWWNPMVHVLKRNFRFALELKCDQFAVANQEDFMHYIRALTLLQNLENEKIARRTNYPGASAFIEADDGLQDRITVLYMRKDESRRKQILINMCYSVAIVALFVFSYMFTILPAFWVPSDVPIAETFKGEYREGDGIFLMDEIFLIDNGDGLFLLYVEGQFVMYVDGASDVMSWLSIRTPTSEGGD